MHSRLMPVFAVLLPAALVLSCGKAERPRGARAVRAPAFDPSEFSGERALELVCALTALGPRASGTPGAEKAALYLADSLKRHGIEVELDEFRDPTPDGEKLFRNVIGIFPGAGEGTIVVGSHYDTKSGIGPGFEGANDSGSSTGVLLEMAPILKKRPPDGPDILMAFFDGEECAKSYSSRDGLHGSRRLASRLAAGDKAGKIRAVIVLDMIGDKNLAVSLPRNSAPELCALIFRAAAAENVRDRFSLGDTGMTDDHEPFMKAGMPAVDVIDFEYGSAPGLNDYWHTPEDTLDKLSADSLEKIGRITLRALNELIED